MHACRWWFALRTEERGGRGEGWGVRCAPHASPAPGRGEPSSPRAGGTPTMWTLPVRIAHRRRGPRAGGGAGAGGGQWGLARRGRHVVEAGAALTLSPRNRRNLARAEAASRSPFHSDDAIRLIPSSDPRRDGGVSHQLHQIK